MEKKEVRKAIAVQVEEDLKVEIWNSQIKFWATGHKHFTCTWDIARHIKVRRAIAKRSRTTPITARDQIN